MEKSNRAKIVIPYFSYSEDVLKVAVIEDDQSVFRGGIESEVRGQRHRIQT